MKEKLGFFPPVNHVNNGFWVGLSIFWLYLTGDHTGLQTKGGPMVFLLSDLMLQTAVLPLRVLPDDHDVNVLMASLDPRERLAVHHVSKQVQACACVKTRSRNNGSHYNKDKMQALPRIWGSIYNSYRRTLFLDLTEGGIVCLVSMLPMVE